MNQACRGQEACNGVFPLQVFGRRYLYWPYSLVLRDRERGGVRFVRPFFFGLSQGL